MEELFNQQDRICFPLEAQDCGQFGQSWQEISWNVKRALKAQSSPSNSDDTNHSRSKAASELNRLSKSKSRLKNQPAVRQNNAIAAEKPLKLKIERSSTEQENVTSCQQLLTKRSLSSFKWLSLADAIKTEENAPFAFRALQISVSPVLRNNNFGMRFEHKQKISLRKESEERAGCGKSVKGGIIEPAGCKEKKGENLRESKSQSSLVMIPAKIDIFIRQEHQSQPKFNDQNMGCIYYRKASHLQEYSHIRTNHNALPSLNLHHNEQPQCESIHATDNRQRWQFVRLSLSKSGKEMRMREKELQQGLQRQLMQAGKGKAFRTPKHRLKLT